MSARRTHSRITGNRSPSSGMTHRRLVFASAGPPSKSAWYRRPRRAGSHVRAELRAARAMPAGAAHATPGPRDVRECRGVGVTFHEEVRYRRDRRVLRPGDGGRRGSRHARRYNGDVPVLQALVAALAFALSAPLAKLLLGDVPPLLLAGLLYLGAGLFLSLLSIVRPRRAANRGFAGHERWLLAGAVTAGGIVAPPLLLWGLSQSPASATALLLNLEVLFTALMAGIVWREHLGRHVIGAAVLMMAGGVVLAWPGGRLAVTMASFAIVTACALWALDNNLTRMIADLDAVRIAQVKGLVAGGVNLVLALAVGQPLPGPVLAAGSLALGAISYGTSLVFFILAMRSLGAARTGGYFALAPFLGALLSVALLSEPISAPLVASGLLLASGVWLLLREHHSHAHTHEAGVHTHRHVHDEHHQHEHEGWEGPEPHAHPHAMGPVEHSHTHVHDEHHRHLHP